MLYPAWPAEETMNDGVELNRFLSEVERKAFYLARSSLGNDEDALDAVQDAMFTLARKYRNKDPEQWKPLFYRILRNRITDQHRRGAVRRRFFSFLRSSGDDADQDPIDLAEGPRAVEPDVSLDLNAATSALGEELSALPPRQQQAFLLRALEGMSVAETASAMKCSEGSVKTHYFRALQTLRTKLEDHTP